jgi:hypothetical protein
MTVDNVHQHPYDAARTHCLWRGAPFIALLCAVVLFHPALARASGSYGWFHPVARVIGPDTSCGAGKAVVDVALKKWGTFDDADPTGTSIQLRILDGATQAVVDEATASSQVVSPTVCFDPSTQAILLTVIGGPNYHDAGGVALSFSDDYLNEAMVGQHVRGYIHLRESSVITPDIEHTFPVGGYALNTNPQLEVTTNTLMPLYDTTSVLDTSVYVRNTSTGVVTSRTYATAGASGTFVLPAMTLPDGYYHWYFHQKVNGQSVVQINAGSFAFQSLPESSFSSAAGFRVDRTAASTALSFPSIAPNDTDETVTIRNTVSDTNSGLASTTITVYDQTDGTLLYRITHTFGPPPPTNTQDVDVAGIVLEAGKTYVISAVTEDVAGNVETTSTTLTVHITPTIGNLSYAPTGSNSVRTSAEVLTQGSTPVTQRGFCWGTSSGTLTNCSSDGSGIGAFTHDFTGIPSGAIYYRAFAHNVDGDAYTSTLMFLLGTPSDSTGSGSRGCYGNDARLYINYSSPGVSHYNVAYCTGASVCDTTTLTPLATNTTATTYTHSGLTFGTLHTYYVQAISDAGVVGAWARVYSTKALDCSAVPPTLDSTSWSYLGTDGTGIPGVRQVYLGARITNNGGSLVSQ